MRTTVTLDPDLVERLRELARRRKISFKEALNSAVRAALVAERGGRRAYKAHPTLNRISPSLDIATTASMWPRKEALTQPDGSTGGEHQGEDFTGPLRVKGLPGRSVLPAPGEAAG